MPRLVAVVFEIIFSIMIVLTPSAADAQEIKIFPVEALTAVAQSDANLKDAEGHTFRVEGEPIVTFEAPAHVAEAVVDKYPVYDIQDDGQLSDELRDTHYRVKIYFTAKERGADSRVPAEIQEVAVVAGNKLFEVGMLGRGQQLPYLYFPARSLSAGKSIAEFFTKKVVLPVAASDITEEGVPGLRLGAGPVEMAKAFPSCRLSLQATEGRGSPVFIEVDCGEELQALAILDDAEGTIEAIIITGGKLQTKSGVRIGTAFERLEGELALETRRKSAYGDCYQLVKEPGITACTSRIDPSTARVTAIIVATE